MTKSCKINTNGLLLRVWLKCYYWRYREYLRADNLLDVYYKAIILPGVIHHELILIVGTYEKRNREKPFFHRSFILLSGRKNRNPIQINEIWLVLSLWYRSSVFQRQWSRFIRRYTWFIDLEFSLFNIKIWGCGQLPLSLSLSLSLSVHYT